MSAPTATAVDPITFEVIRHRLWAINDEQALMAARLSPSPVVHEALDFNAALLTADGRGLYAGIYIVMHASTMDVFVGKVLEQWRLEDIHEGDMFFTNDPWCGALHANDGILITPIFWEGEIVTWAGIVMHDDDVGSPVPGSFVVGGEDRFGEAPLFPPIKMVEDFELREDIERAYLRNHRTAELNALNLRARLASLRITHRRIHELIGQYGVEALIASQEQIVAYVEAVVRRRLATMPDGTWCEQVYHDHNGRTHDLYLIRCRVTKVGDSLTVDFTGTAEQAPGAVNCARPAMEGAVLGIFLTMFCFDLPWSVGAIREVVEIVSEEGTINNATSPAAVSMASIMAMLSTADAASTAFAKMLMASDDLRSEAQACWSPGCNITVTAGLDRHGEPFAHMFLDAAAGGGGARSFRDGIDTGGGLESMSSTAPNVESSESRAPVLELYRRERRDSGGHGRWRGGVGVEYAILPHKSPIPVTAIMLASGVSQPEGHGISGGSPASVKSNLIYRGTDIRAWMAAGKLPWHVQDLSAESVETRAAKDFAELAPDDILVAVVCGGGGYGDPLRREPERVARDVREGLVSEQIARSVYGVVLDGGVPSVEATERARAEIRLDRRRNAEPANRSPAEGDVVHRLADTLEVVDSSAGLVVRCTECHHGFGGAETDYKRAAAMRELPITATSELNASGLVGEVVLREFCCPGCGTAVAMDVQRREEPIREESRLFARDPHVSEARGKLPAIRPT